jgi:cellulose synthase/poly-beta-1,6-N-acetylglucosamine synthase-like glycosyltransferase
VRSWSSEDGRKTSLGSSEGFYWRYESFLKRHESLTGSTVTVVGELMAVRRTLWKPIPKGVINDDAYLGLNVINAGYRVIYEPAARCEESASAHAGSDRTRRKRMTAGRWQLLFRPEWLPWGRPGDLLKLSSHKILRLLMPVILLCALVGNLAAIVLDPSPATWLQATAAAQLIALSLALLGGVLHGTRLRWKPADVAFFVFNGNLGTFLGMLAFLRGRQSVLWDKVR